MRRYGVVNELPSAMCEKYQAVEKLEADRRHDEHGRAGGKQDPRSRWLGKLRQRRHPNIVAVALANKNARIAWALLSNGEAYDPSLTVGPT
jgi:hypothetical protein